MKIIRSYILRESIIPFILALGILTCVFLLGNLIQLTNMVINKGVALSTVAKVFLLYVPVLLGYTIPIACLVSIILTFSKFSTDNEILAIRSCGIHLWNILKPLLVIGTIISCLLIILNERVIPYAHHEQRKLLKNLGVKNPTALLEEGAFINSFDNQTVFIHKIEGNKLFNVTIYQPQKDGKTTRTIIAKRGEFTPIPGKNQIKLKLMDGTSDEPNANNPGTFYKLNFDSSFITLDFSQKNKTITKKPKSMTLRELKKEIEFQERRLVDTEKLKTEYYRKITWSFSPLVFILLGFPIAVITNRREKSANVVLAIICAVIYYLLSLGCEALSVQKLAPIPIIMWTPTLVGLITAGYFNYKCVS